MTLADYNQPAGRVVRFVDHNDLVTRVPSRNDDFDHVGPTVYLTANGTLDLNMTEWTRFLNSVYDAVGQFRIFAKSSLTDHSMERYVAVLENLANQ